MESFPLMGLWLSTVVEACLKTISPELRTDFQTHAGRRARGVLAGLSRVSRTIPNFVAPFWHTQVIDETVRNRNAVLLFSL